MDSFMNEFLIACIIIFFFNNTDNTKPSEDTKKCPHESNGPNWIPFKNNCYTFLLRAMRWQEHDNKNGQQTCQSLGTGKYSMNIYVSKSL